MAVIAVALILLLSAAGPVLAQTAPGAGDASAARALQLLRSEAYDEALRLYRRIAVAEPDNARAQYDLAAALGFLQRYAEAIEPIEAAIRLAPDSIVFHQAAAIIYANNHDDEQAFEASLRAAQLGEITAMFELVWMYRDGRGVDADEAKALHWAERAAGAGHVAAMDLLVQAYLNGDLGASPDRRRAEHWALAAWRARRGAP